MKFYKNEKENHKRNKEDRDGRQVAETVDDSEDVCETLVTRI